MKVNLTHRPGNAAAEIFLAHNEEVTAEAGSMISMDSNITVTTTSYKKGGGSILKGIKRMLAGESFFLNHFKSQGANGKLLIAPTALGDITTVNIENKKIIVQAGSFLAMETSCHMETGWQGFKNFLSGESLFWLELSGKGQVLLSSYGAIYEIDIEDEYIVDTGHIVAFENTMNFSLSKAGSSWLHSYLGGEGIVCHFKGKGKLWCQSHNFPSFGTSIASSLKPR